MSAHIVSDKTVNYIVSGALKYKAMPWFLRSADKPAQAITSALINANYDSVNSRYNEDDKAHEIAHETISEICPKVLYGLISYYEYQACEVENYQESDIAGFLRNLKEAAFKALIGQNEYDNLPWGLED